MPCILLSDMLQILFFTGGVHCENIMWLTWGPGNPTGLPSLSLWGIITDSWVSVKSFENHCFRRRQCSLSPQQSSEFCIFACAFFCLEQTFPLPHYHFRLPESPCNCYPVPDLPLDFSFCSAKPGHSLLDLPLEHKPWSCLGARAFCFLP